MTSVQIHTIGEFGRLTGLTEKALRLYDRRGLLRPAAVDPANGYRLYSADQVDDGRLISMMRAIDMPLNEIEVVLGTDPSDRSAAVGRYWYRIERDLDDHRAIVKELRGISEAEEHGMSHAETAIAVGRTDGAFAAVAQLAQIADLAVAANAYSETMRSAYWEDKDVSMVTAIAYAGASRLLAAAETAESDVAYEIRTTAKGLMYDLASFTWTGWDEPGVEVGATDAAAGLAAARSNLAMAIELDKDDLRVSRGYWMLGGHLLTAGNHQEAISAFGMAAEHAQSAGAQAEVALAEAFSALAQLGAGDAGAGETLATTLKELEAAEGGEMFIAQVETARGVLGI